MAAQSLSPVAASSSAANPTAQSTSPAAGAGTTNPPTPPVQFATVTALTGTTVIATQSGSPLSTGTPTQSTSSKTAAHVQPAALLEALVDAWCAREQLSATAALTFHQAQLTSIVSLKSAADLSTFQSQFTAIQKADSAYRAQREQSELCRESLSHNGILLMLKHKDAAEAVERKIRGVMPRQDPHPLEILRHWEVAARGRKPRRGKKVNRKAAGRAGKKRP